MRSRRLILCAAIALLALAGCARGRDDPRRAVPAGAGGSLLASLVGTWVRPIPGRGTSLEGIVLDADGGFGLIGIHTMHGLTWRLEGNTLILATNTGRYPLPQEARLQVAQITQASLTLQADADYLSGTYTRSDGAANVISGTVTYRQPIVLPPNASINLELSEVSLANNTALFIAGQTLPTLGRQVPIPFRLYYATADINPTFTYSLSATIVVDGTRRFLTDTPYRMITGDWAKTVEIVVLPLEERETPSPAPRSTREPAPTVTAPATYSGVVGCRECAGSRLTLTLRTDGIYFLRQARPGKAGDPGEIQRQLGRWRIADGGRSLVLSAGAETPRRFAVLDAQTLRMLNSPGQAIDPRGQYDILLARDVDPFPETFRLRGMYYSMPEARFLTECLTGRRFTVAPGADNAALESAYVGARPDQGQPLLVSVEGRFARRPRTDGRGTQEVIVIDRFVDARLGERCAFAQATASLEDTSWKLVELGGKLLPASPERRGPQLRLLTVAHSVEGFAGCNEFSGTYELDGSRIRIIRMETTRKTCREWMEEERAFLRLLGSSPMYEISGENLALIEGGIVQARFESAYPR